MLSGVVIQSWRSFWPDPREITASAEVAGSDLVSQMLLAPASACSICWPGTAPVEVPGLDLPHRGLWPAPLVITCSFAPASAEVSCLAPFS